MDISRRIVLPYLRASGCNAVRAEGSSRALRAHAWSGHGRPRFEERGSRSALRLPSLLQDVPAIRTNGASWPRLLERSFRLYSLPCRIDLGRTRFGAAAQFLRRAGEAIGMILADQLAVRALDGALVGVARHAQHRVRIGTGRRTRRAAPAISIL